MQEEKIVQNRAIWGILLVGAGLLFLLQNLGIVDELSGLIWAGLFGAGGLVFLYFFLADRQNVWWAAIPGCTLLGLSAVIFFGDYAPAPLDQLAGTFFLGAIGAGFALVYLTDPHKWWAIIPAGVLGTLGVVAAADELAPWGVDNGGLFFVGLGLTFLVVALAPGSENRRWALIPAAVLLVMGMLIGVSALNMFGYLWPLALIVGGLFLLWRNWLAKEV